MKISRIISGICFATTVFVFLHLFFNFWHVKDPISSFAKEKNRIGNSLSNIHNEGIVAEQGDWIAYGSNRGLFISQKDGSYKKRLTRDIPVRFINFAGDWIVYSTSEGIGGPSNKLFKVKVNGSKRQKLSDDEASNVIVNGDYIYYINALDGYSIYRIKLDGSAKQKINNDHSTRLNVDGDWIYYSKVRSGIDLDSSIMKIKVDGTSKQKISDEDAHEMIVSGDWIFYTNASDNFKIYKIKINGSEKIKINNNESENLIFHKGLIYYVNVDYNYLLSVTTPDGIEDEKKLPHKILKRYFNLIANRAYYLDTDGNLQNFKLDDSIQGNR